MEIINDPNQLQVKPKTWLVESILATIFCCLPLGIVGIVNAAKVESKYNTGDVVGALESSKEAGKWTKISFFIGIAVYVIYILVAFLGVFSSILD